MIRRVRVLLRHFVVLIACNVLLTFLLLVPIFGTEHFGPALAIGMVIKLFSYGAAVLYELWLYAPKRECYLKNMGFGYRELFTPLFLFDFILFFSIVFLWRTLVDFM